MVTIKFASGDDNITVALCKVLSGALEPKKSIRKNKLTNTVSFSPPQRIRIKKGLLIKLLILIVMMGVFYYGGFVNGRHGMQPQPSKESLNIDSVTKLITDSLQNVCDSLKEVNEKNSKLISENEKTISSLEKEIEKLKGDTIRVNKELRAYLKKVSGSSDDGKANSGDSVASEKKN